MAALTFVASRGITTQKANDTTLALSPDATIPAGAVVVVLAAARISGTSTNGETNFLSVSDSQSNTWTKAREHGNGVTTGGGQTYPGAIFVSTLTTAIGTSDTITLTTSETSAARVIAASEWSMNSGNTLDIVAVAGNDSGIGGSTDSPTVSLSGLDNVERTWVGAVAIGNPPSGSHTEDDDYTQIARDGTSGSSGPTNVTGNYARRTAQLTGDTYNPTIGSAVWSAIIVALEQVSGGVSVNVGRALEHDQARAFTIQTPVTFGPALEHDIARPFGMAAEVSFGQATEENQARAFKPVVGNFGSRVIGFSQTREWYQFGNFEGYPGIENDEWELYWNSGGDLTFWSNPEYNGWTNPTIFSAMPSTHSVHRAIFNISGGSRSVAQWEADIEAMLPVLRDKIPTAYEIYLQPVIGHREFDTDPICEVGGSEVRADRNHPFIVQAIQNVIPNHSDVFMGAAVRIEECAWFGDSLGHLLADGYNDAASKMATFWGEGGEPFANFGGAREEDQARSFTPTKQADVGRALEHDVARSFAPVRSVDVGRALEENQARSFTASHEVQVGRALEENTARVFALVKSVEVGRALEEDQARGFRVSHQVQVGRALESDLARAFATVDTVTFGPALEHDTARAFGVVKNVSVGKAQEENQARGFTASHLVSLGRALEQDVGRSFGVVKSVSVGRALEADLARGFEQTQAIDYGRAFEEDIARAFTVSQPLVFGPALEHDLARAFTTVAGEPVGIHVTLTGMGVRLFVVFGGGLSRIVAGGGVARVVDGAGLALTTFGPGRHPLPFMQGMDVSRRHDGPNVARRVRGPGV